MDVSRFDPFEHLESGRGVPLGYQIISDNYAWEVWSCGNVVIFNPDNVESPYEAKHLPLAVELAKEIVSNFGIIPFEPSVISDVVSARLDMDINNTQYSQTITDSAILASIEGMLSEARHDWTVGCPAGALLTLTLATGEEIMMQMAVDSCMVFYVNGQIFLRSGDNEAFYAYFDQIPTESRFD
jgi:hypothetical protein